MSQLPNPSTPLAFFPPEAAEQTAVFYYVSVGSLAVSLTSHVETLQLLRILSLRQIFVWDVLENLGDDYRLLTEYRITVTTCAYLSSR